LEDGMWCRFHSHSFIDFLVHFIQCIDFFDLFWSE
jgi:hypothetical protein